MAFTDTPKIGVILDNIQQVAGADLGKSHSLGSSVKDNLNRECVYVEADAAIAADLTTVAVNMTTFKADATGGAFIAPPVAAKKGDRFWVCTPAA